MNRTWIVFVKELVDNLRDKRTISTALFFGPIFGPLIFMLLINMTVKLAKEEFDLPLELPVVGAELAPNLMQFLAENNVKVVAGPKDPKQAVRDKDLALVLVVPEQFPQDFR